MLQQFLAAQLRMGCHQLRVEGHQRCQHETALLPAWMWQLKTWGGVATVTEPEQVQIQAARTPVGTGNATGLLLQGLELPQQGFGGAAALHQHHAVDVIGLMGRATHCGGAKPGGAAEGAGSCQGGQRRNGPPERCQGIAPEAGEVASQGNGYGQVFVRNHQTRLRSQVG